MFALYYELCYNSSMKIMHHPKPEEFSLTAVLYAFSDPTRLGILQKLSGEARHSCSDFACGVSKSTMSHHFRVLREAGLINVAREGTQHQITLRRAEMAERFPGLLEAVLAAVEK